MKTRENFRNRQGGAVAVIVGISIVLLVGFLAMVIDLGHLYVAKTGLQNAADAAALSGAKQLNGTADRICCDTDSAVARAIDTTGRNTFFGNNGDDVVNIGSAVESNTFISFSSSPSGPWVTITDAKASPSDKYFIKVDTASGNLKTWFAPVWEVFGPGQGFLNTSTFGMAVVGPIMQNVAPLAVCALQPASPLTEYGFRRGASYNIIEVNNLYVGVGGFTSVPLWLNPVDIPPASCDPSHGSNSFMNSFVCQGTSAILNVGNGYDVYVNTGTTAAQKKPLDSRFDDYTGSPCDVATAPPDLNVKPYPCVNSNGSDGCWKTGDAEEKVKIDKGPPVTQPIPGFPRDWMTSDPIQQAMSPIQKGSTVPNPNDFAHYGVLWSYAWERNWSTGSDYGLCDWGDNTTVPVGQPCNGVSGANLYGGLADQTSNGYPTTGTPYQASSGKYFQAPNPSRPGKVDRRVLNAVIVDCPKAESVSCPVGGMPGYQVPTLAIGRFFMTEQAGLPDRLDVEFAGVLPAAALERHYRLFR